MEEAKKRRDELLEGIAEVDDQMLISYVEHHPVTPIELKMAIRRATIAGLVNPILCGAALRNKGVHPLLDAVLDYLPSPVEVPAVTWNEPEKWGNDYARAAARTSRFRRWRSRWWPTLTWAGSFISGCIRGWRSRGRCCTTARAARPRAARADSSNAREPAGGYRRDRGGADRGDGRAEEHVHGRHALRRDEARSSSRRSSSRSR